jgi:hypothetical protein
MHTAMNMVSLSLLLLLLLSSWDERVSVELLPLIEQSVHPGDTESIYNSGAMVTHKQNFKGIDETCPIATLSNINSIRTTLGLNQGLRGD